MENTTEEISYSELARRVGDCVLNNEVRAQLSGGYDFELVNGDDTYCVVHEDNKECQEHSEKCEHEACEVYQEYIITPSGATYLEENTNEIVYYCEELNIHLWAITHFGTGWDCVFTQIKKTE